MKATQTAVNYVCALALLSALFLRIFAADRVWLGRNGARWALLLAIAACAIKLAAMMAEIVVRRTPWGRLLLPAVFLAELVRVYFGETTRMQAGIVVVLFELALILAAVAFLVFRNKEFRSTVDPEETLEGVFEFFLPERLARASASELVLLWSGARWCANGFRLQAPPGFGYVGESMVAYFPVLVPMLVIAEGIAYELLMRGHPGVRFVLLVLGVWAIFWAFGSYATMKSRPHMVTAERVRLNCGLLGRCEFPPALLLDAQTRPAGSTGPDKTVGRLCLKNTPGVLLTLREPVLVERTFAADRKFQSILISADDPEGLRRALLARAAVAVA